MADKNQNQRAEESAQPDTDDFTKHWPLDELSDEYFLKFDDDDQWTENDPDESFVYEESFSKHVYDQAKEVGGFGGGGTHFDGSSSSRGVSGGSEKKERFAFKTKSDVEVLDDGYKWRKYGKKMVKNSPNPRNYYRCSADGCPVKKRVERDSDDPRYVITTYEGTHTHPSCR